MYHTYAIEKNNVWLLHVNT